MNTFLLYWNPHFSSYKVERFLKDFHFPRCKDVLTDSDDWDRSPDFFNWSMVEYQKAKRGDRFFFVRVGFEKPTGLVGAGCFTSDPYEDKDWSGQKRKVFYMDMQFDEVVNPASDKVFSTEQLTASIPEIDWTRGKAGVLIPEEIAEKVEALWKKHIESIK